MAYETLEIPDSVDFLKQIEECISEGYRIVPFLGSGISKAAGIPLVNPLERRELRYWMLRALGLNPWARPEVISPDNWSELVDTDLPHWYPRINHWPDLAMETAFVSEGQKPRHFNPDNAAKILLKALQVSTDLSTSRPDNSVSDNMFESRTGLSILVLAEGYRLLQEKGGWQQIIEFLGRLDWEFSDKRGWKLVLGRPNNAVADSLFNHLTRRRQPTLCHRMLTALAPVWRSDVLLTINFDTLTEQAFALSGSEITTFEVPHPVPLPDSSLVLSNRALVKLHGGRFGLWADASIDEPASQRDQSNFLNYLTGHKTRERSSSEPAHTSAKVALVVLGTSGLDGRVQSLLTKAWQSISQIKIFWVSRKQLPSKFLGCLTGLTPDASSRKSKGVFLHRHSDHGLLLLQLYQMLTLNIPTSGAVFPGLWELPEPPIIRISGKQRSKASETIAAIVNTINEGIVSPDRTGSKPIIFTSSDNGWGGVTLAANIFHEKVIDAECLWMELGEVRAPVGFFLRLMLMLAQLEGSNNPVTTLNMQALGTGESHDYATFRTETFCEAVRGALQRTYSRTGQPVVLFVNIQDGVGLFSPFWIDPSPSDSSSMSPDTHRGHNHSEIAGDHWWKQETAVIRMLNLIGEINAEPSCGIQFVFLRRGESPSDGRFFYENLNLQGWNSLSFDSSLLTDFSPPRAVEGALAWATSDPENEETPRRLAFLLLLTSFRHIRYPAALNKIFSEFVKEQTPRFGTPPSSARQEIEVWLETLEQSPAKVLRFKLGGFVWINTSAREALKGEIKRHWQSGAMSLSYNEASISFGALIARWYGRLLLGAADPLAALEGVFHALQAAESAVEGLRPIQAQRPDSQSDQLQYRAIVILRHARLLLRTTGGLLTRRLSSQFADQSIMMLKQEAQDLVERISVKEYPTLHAALDDLLCDIVKRAPVILLREAQFQRVIDLDRSFLAQRKDSRRTKEWQYAHRVTKLYASGAALQSRRYDDAQECLLDLADDLSGGKVGPIWHCLSAVVCRPQSPDPDKSAYEAQQLLRLWLAEWRDRDAGELSRRLRLVVQIARWQLYLLLNKSQVRFLKSALHDEAPGSSPNSPEGVTREKLRWEGRSADLTWALGCYEFGIELLRAIPETDDGFVFEENVRLRAHAALCRGLLETAQAREHGRQPDLSQARIMASDAQAYIDEFPLKEGGVNDAIVALRRAELSLIEFGGATITRTVRTYVRSYLGQKHSHSVMKDAVRLADGDLIKLLALSGRLHDASADFERAEEQLRQHPKSRWWWWIYCVLKLKACEYLHLTYFIASLSDKTSHLEGVDSNYIDFMNIQVLHLLEAKDITDTFYLSRVIFSYATTLGIQWAMYRANIRINPDDRRQCAAEVDRNGIKLRRRHLGALLKMQGRLREPHRQKTGIDPAVEGYAQYSQHFANQVVASIDRGSVSD